MRRSASEIINNLERRIARLEGRKSSSRSFSVYLNYTLYDEDEREITNGHYKSKMTLEDFQNLSDEDAYLIPSRGSSMLVEQDRGMGRSGYLGYTFDVSQKENDDDILRSETMQMGIEFHNSVSQDTLDAIETLLS